MAIITAYGGQAYSLSSFVAHNLLDGLYYEGTATEYVILYDDTDLVSPVLGAVDYFQGFDFSYVAPNDPTPVSGTITAYGFFYDETLLIEVLGLSLSAVALTNAAATVGTADEQALYRAELQGADLINGSSSGDLIEGFGGADALFGNGGADWLIGGFGKDRLSGGSDVDVFDFNSKLEAGKGAGRDVILDFERLFDWIDLRTIDAKSDVGGNQAFKWIGKQGFHGTAGELRFVKKAGYVLVEGDIDGNGKADFQIQVDGLGALSRADFIL